MVNITFVRSIVFLFAGSMIFGSLLKTKMGVKGLVAYIVPCIIMLFVVNIDHIYGWFTK